MRALHFLDGLTMAAFLSDEISQADDTSVDELAHWAGFLTMGARSKWQRAKAIL